MTVTAGPARTRPGAGPLVIFALGALSAFGPLSMDMYLPALDQVVHELRASESSVAVSVSACLIGLAVGQLLFGPLSDRFGRRVPLLTGVGLWALTSGLCGLAPDVRLLIGARFLQGVSGAGGVVVARATVRDRFAGSEVIRIFSVLMLVSGVAPILAPLAGGLLLRFMSWRGLFFVLAGLGVLLWTLAWVALPESLPVEHRNPEGFRRTARDVATLGRDRLFVGATLSMALAAVALFGYLVLSSFVFQGQFRLSPTAYSMLFAVNSAGIMAAGRLNASLVRRHHATKLLAGALVVLVAAAAAMVAGGVFAASGTGGDFGGRAGLLAVAVPTFLVISSMGMVLPNCTGLALAHHGDRAGTASALLGGSQFLFGALASPVAGALGGTNARTMGLVALTGAVLAGLSYLLLVRPATAAESDL